MQIFYFSQSVTIILCFVLSPFLQILAAVIARALPQDIFISNKGWFKTRKFEQDGKIYERVFKIKHWKKLLPDGSAMTGVGMRKKHLNDFTSENLELYLAESCKAELIHVLAIPPFALFCLFCPPYVVAMMLTYAVLINLPCIMAQRYNRPRIRKMLKKRELSQKKAVNG